MVARTTKTTHEERVAASRAFPPPSVEDILCETRRVLAADLADGGVGYSLERASFGSDTRMTAIAAVHRALVNLRDGWLERPRGDAERREAIAAISRAAGIDDDEIAVWAWSLDAGRTEVLGAVDRALVAASSAALGVARRVA